MLDYIQDLLDDYKNKRFLYEEFSSVMCKIIEGLLEEGNYKYQMNHRIKDIHHLEEKIIRKKQKGKIYASLNDIKDVVGIRVIFYLESDKNKFIKNIRNEISGKLIIEEKKKVS